MLSCCHRRVLFAATQSGPGRPQTGPAAYLEVVKGGAGTDYPAGCQGRHGFPVNIMTGHCTPQTTTVTGSRFVEASKAGNMRASCVSVWFPGKNSLSRVRNLLLKFLWLKVQASMLSLQKYTRSRPWAAVQSTPQPALPTELYTSSVALPVFLLYTCWLAFHYGLPNHALSGSAPPQ